MWNYPLLSFTLLIATGLANPIPSPKPWKERAEKVDLRILSLGASIVSGSGSKDMNGFRRDLREQLRFKGWNVNMVGTKSHGTMKDNDVEAVGGITVDEARINSKNAYAYKPNVVLIQVGNNDCTQNKDIDNVGKRMRSLITELLDADGMDRTTVILSTLIPNMNEKINKCRDNPENGVNKQYRDLAKALRKEGRRVVLADMDPPAPHPAHGWINKDDYPVTDGTHPNENGFRKMAAVFYKGILRAKKEGKLLPPHSCESGDGKLCGKKDKAPADDSPVPTDPKLPRIPCKGK